MACAIYHVSYAIYRMPALYLFSSECWWNESVRFFLIHLSDISSCNLLTAVWTKKCAVILWEIDRPFNYSVVIHLNEVAFAYFLIVGYEVFAVGTTDLQDVAAPDLLAVRIFVYLHFAHYIPHMLTDLHIHMPINYISTCLTCSRTYKLTDLYTYIPTDLQTYNPTDLQSYRPTILQSNRPTDLQTYNPTVLQSYSPTDLQTYRPTILQSNRSTCKFYMLTHLYPLYPQTIACNLSIAVAVTLQFLTIFCMLLLLW